jgi:tetratricopeptide (TPR) repeat protein
MHYVRRLTALVAFVLAAQAMMPPVLAADNDEESAEGLELSAQLALEADDYLRAVQQYVKAARQSDDPGVAERATRTAFGLGFNDEALAAAERWLELDSGDEQALAYFAQLELRVGDLKAARDAFREVIESGTEPPDQRLLTLLGIFSGEDPAKVDKLVRMLAEPYGESALANYAAGVTALQAGDYDYAKERALRAAEIDPEWVKAKLLYARALLLAGDEDEAIDYTARIVGDDPNPDPDARMELALMYLSAGRDEDALSQVNQVLLEQSARSDALRLMAIINFRLQNFDAARDDFEDLLASGRYTMDALYYLARIADIRGETDRAIRLYSEVKNGDNAVLSQRRAAALVALRKDEPEAALEMLDDFADENPQFAIDVVVARAQLLGSLERYDEALAEFDRAVTYRPEDESMALGRAELLLRMGRLDDAIDAYRDAVRRWPDSAMSLNALGYTLADRTDEYREAEKLIRKALKYDPESPAIIDSLGWVLYKRGKYAKALEQLEIAYEEFPDPEVAAHLVEVLAVMGREDEALAILTEAEAFDADHELLQQVRQRFFATDPVD